MSEVYVSAMIQAQEGKEEAMKMVLAAVIADVRAEEGCIRYDLHQCVSDPARFLFYEIWESQAHLDAHGETAHIAKLRENMGPLLAGDPEVLIHQAVDVAQ